MSHTEGNELAASNSEPARTHTKSAPKPNQSNYSKDLDALFDLIESKIPDHHLKPQFIADCKASLLRSRSRLIDEIEAKLPEKDNNDWSKIPHELGNTFGEGFDSAVKEVKKILEDYR